MLARIQDIQDLHTDRGTATRGASVTIRTAHQDACTLLALAASNRPLLGQEALEMAGDAAHAQQVGLLLLDRAVAWGPPVSQPRTQLDRAVLRLAAGDVVAVSGVLEANMVRHGSLYGAAFLTKLATRVAGQVPDLGERVGEWAQEMAACSDEGLCSRVLGE